MVEAIDLALEVPCITVVIDPGDLTRADQLADISGRYSAENQEAALLAADALIGHVRTKLALDDLLLVVSPTSPAWDPEVHFGVALAGGPGFPAGSELESPSTRRPGMVTLPDVAPTVLKHLGKARPASMLGRGMFARLTGNANRIPDAIALDREAVFIDGIRAPLSTVFVVAQVLLYALVGLLLAQRTAQQRSRSQPRARPVAVTRSPRRDGVPRLHLPGGVLRTARSRSGLVRPLTGSGRRGDRRRRRIDDQKLVRSVVGGRIDHLRGSVCGSDDRCEPPTEHGVQLLASRRRALRGDR